MEANKGRQIIKEEPGMQHVTGSGLSFLTWQLWLGATDAQPNAIVCITKTHTDTREGKQVRCIPGKQMTQAAGNRQTV